jgi:UDP-N-acetylglucosamine acyltransferase
MSIHPTAVIAPTVQLGQGVAIGPFACIEDDVVVGDGCVIGPHVCLMRFTRLGANCRIHAGAVLGDLPQDRNFTGSESCVEIGAGCVIREGATVHRGTQAGSVTRVGDHCMLMAYSHLAHNVTLGHQVVVCNNALLAGHVQVGDQAFISGNCLVHQFTRIGRLAMLSGGSGVQMDVPPFCITRSLFSNTVMNLNVVGLRRAGLSAQERRLLQCAFDILYGAGLPVSRALERLEQEFDSPHVHELCEFVRTSKRGICKFIRDAEGEAADAFPRLAAA